jgi:dienelactone hydrolase
MPGFEQSMRRMFSGTAARPPAPSTPDAMAAGIAPQLEDARAAFALIRRRAAEWRVDPSRIGMVGFSAGAMLTLTTALAGQDAKPAFIGDIYGPVGTMTVPADAPPLFVAVAADFYTPDGEAWRVVYPAKSGKKPVKIRLGERQLSVQ